jgi:hypothetical protein
VVGAALRRPPENGEIGAGKLNAARFDELLGGSPAGVTP